MFRGQLLFLLDLYRISGTRLLCLVCWFSNFFNMNWLFNFFRKLFGDWSSPSSALQNFGESGSNSSLVRLVNKGQASPSSVTLSDVFGSIVASLTGAHLTGAQREANAFTAEREDLAWARQMEASNTQYQRATNDMRAAGLNPILAAGAGTSTPSASVAGSVSPSSAAFGMDSILSLARMAKLLPLEAESIQASIDKTKADTSRTVSETKGLDIENNYRDESERLRLEGQGLSNTLSREQVGYVRKQVDSIEQSIRLQAEQEKTEVKKQALLSAQEFLASANAYQVVAMLPYQQALAVANTESAKQSACLAAANAAMQNGLISSGWIAAQVRKAHNEGELAGKNVEAAVIQNEVNEVRSMFRTGKIPEGSSMDNGLNRFVLNNVLMPLELLLDNFNPLAGILNNAK